jgi:NADH:ubiquinone oxidoreductase subunit C
MAAPSLRRVEDPYREPWVGEEQARAALAPAADAEPGAATAAAGEERPHEGALEALAGDAATAFVPAAEHRDVARRLVAAGFTQLVYLVASHHADDHIEVACALRRPGPGSKVASWRLRLAAGEAAPSLADLLAGADWQEREQFDLVGVRFAGHPDLRRLLLPDDWRGHPLRRDYPADAACRPWR